MITKNLESIQLEELDIHSKIETDGEDMIETTPLDMWWDPYVEIVKDYFK